MLKQLLLLLALLAAGSWRSSAAGSGMSDAERLQLRDKAKEMFFHAYNGYMRHAYPADELMPVTCRGRFRGSQPSRGDIDDSLGNYSLTLIDSLDTLLLMGEPGQFERAVRLVADSVTFDTDVVVSVFEVNIRVLGGLLGGHVGAMVYKVRGGMAWYDGQLLRLASDLGRRLLPAFNTSTGIPFPRINLRRGIVDAHKQQDTCTACAGSMLLEFAALSRLSGSAEFEQKARRALDALWRQRNLHSNLVGTVINIHNGDWIRKESGIGAGIDSYYEYLFKAYVMLGEEVYLHRFSKHYEAVQNYLQLCKSPLLTDVLMHQPLTRTRNFMDALLAFWPGLQVMAGDLRPAVELHEILYQVVQRYNFIPEAFTHDFHVHWAHHPLRPEFIESTYFLFKATRDPHYLQVGSLVIRNLEKFSRTTCGYAAINDVRTMEKSDQMDSFVLAETFKYLYLLFADESDLPIDLNAYVFTTEAHILPLELANVGIRPGNVSSANASSSHSASSRRRRQLINGSCPNYNMQRSIISNSAHYWRQQLQRNNEKLPAASGQSAEAAAAAAANLELPIDPRQLDVNRHEHQVLLAQMGISTVRLESGQLQLFHNGDNAKSLLMGKLGLRFIQAMIQLAQETHKADLHPPNYLYYPLPAMDKAVFNFSISGSVEMNVGPSQFGPALATTGNSHMGYLLSPHPWQQDGCSELSPVPQLLQELELPWLLLLRRGNCLFVQKVRNAEAAGAAGVIVYDNVPNSVSEQGRIFAMSSDGGPNVTIPSVFVFGRDASNLRHLMHFYSGLVPIVISGRQLAGQALSSHWLTAASQSEQASSPLPNYANACGGVLVHQTYTVHRLASQLGHFGLTADWAHAGSMTLTIHMDRNMSQAYTQPDFEHYWLALQHYLMQFSNLAEFYDQQPMLQLLKDAVYLAELAPYSAVLANDKLPPIAKLFNSLSTSRVSAAQLPLPMLQQQQQLFVAKTYTFTVLPAE